MHYNHNRVRKSVMAKGVMQATDMFSEKMLQVFSRKTGEYLGYVYQGQDPETLQEEIEHIPWQKPEKLINQLELF